MSSGSHEVEHRRRSSGSSPAPTSDAPGLFIAEDIQGYPRAAGHYTAKGNARAAKWLYQKLAKIPALAGKFGPTTRPAVAP